MEMTALLFSALLLSLCALLGLLCDATQSFTVELLTAATVLSADTVAGAATPYLLLHACWKLSEFYQTYFLPCFCHSPLHSWKSKTKKLRGRNRSLATHKSQGSMAVQQYTRRPTVFTSERISETCNTDYPHVSEDEVDRELNLS